MRVSRFCTHLFLLSATASAAHAQFDNTWVTFAQEPARLVSASGPGAQVIATTTARKGMAFGDLDQDGWTDLVIVTHVGNQGAFLLMNSQGVLIDRTATLAADTNVAGDSGFLYPTSNRDVKIADVNGDGWLDVITSGGQLSVGTPTWGNMPRVYVNKGVSTQGVWLGLRFENGRVQPHADGLNYGDVVHVACADVTGDGFPDLFVETKNSRDALLVNDGTGVFVQTGTTRMSANMLWHGGVWGWGVRIVDMNGDGLRDIVRAKGTLSIAYNDPAQVGFFPEALWTADVGQTTPRDVDVADMNLDGRMDFAYPDDGLDGMRYGIAFDAQNRLIFGPILNHQFVTGGDDGFASRNAIADLDLDGYPDLIQADVDHYGMLCTTRCHVYHNRATSPGAFLALREEAGQATGNWRGVVGMLETDLRGTFDVAPFDIDNDGDLDLVFGRCTGTFVWMNQLVVPPPVTASCFGDGTGTACPCGNFGSAGRGCANAFSGAGARLTATGRAGILGDTFKLVADGVPNSPGLYFQAAGLLGGGNGVTFGDGLLCGGFGIARLGVAFAATNTSQLPNASLPTPVHVTGATQAGDLRHYQLWYRDGDLTFCTPLTNNLTNVVSVTWAN